MSFLPGGKAGKLGDEYEVSFVIEKFLDIVSERLQAVVYEPIGDDEVGVDLITYNIDLCGCETKRLYQCKARNKSYKSWTVNSLAEEEVLNKVKKQLTNDSDVTYNFISAIQSTDLNDLCNHVRQSDSCEILYNSLPSSQKELFDKFSEGFGYDCTQVEGRYQTYDILKRCYFNTVPDDNERKNRLSYYAEYLFEGEGSITVSILKSFAIEKFGNKLTANDIVKYLETKGIKPKTLFLDKRILPVIQELKEKFYESIEDYLLCKSIMHREETDKCFKLLEQNNIIMLYGEPGTGKSGVLLEVIKNIDIESNLVLPIRLDRITIEDNELKFSRDSLGLPDKLTYCLTSIAHGKPCYLILDQLDALRLIGGTSQNALSVCKEVVRHVNHINKIGGNIKIIFSCRTYDLEHDPQLKTWFQNEDLNETVKLEVRNPSKNSLKQFVGSLGITIPDLSSELLCNIQNFKMWLDTKEEIGNIEEISTTEILFRYINSKLNEVSRISKFSVQQINEVLKNIVDYLDKNNCLSIPAEKLGFHSTNIINSMCSCGLIAPCGKLLLFSHQSIFEYLLMVKIEKEIEVHDTILKWLGDKEEQNLVKRFRLQSYLQVKIKECTLDAFKTCKELFESDNVRFIYKQMVLSILNTIDKSVYALDQFVIKWVVDDYWKWHIVKNTVTGNKHFVKLLYNDKIIEKLIISENEDTKLAFELLDSVINDMPEEIMTLLSNIMENYENTNIRIYIRDYFGHHFPNTPEPIYSFQLQNISECVNFGFLRIDKFEEMTNDALKKFIDLIFNKMLLNISELHQSNFHFSSTDYDADIKQISKKLNLNDFINYIDNLNNIGFKYENTNELKDILFDDSPYQNKSIASFTFEIIAESGKLILNEFPNEVINALSGKNSYIIDVLASEIFTCVPDCYADSIVNWLFQDKKRFLLGRRSTDMYYHYTYYLIKSISKKLSDKSFIQLENYLYHHTDSKRIQDLKTHFEFYRLTRSPYNYSCFSLVYNKPKFILMKSLCETRTTIKTKDLIRCLKKVILREPTELRGIGVGEAFSVVSAISENGSKFSDKTWISILECPDVDVHDRRIRPGHKSVSILDFARTLELCSAADQTRFANLALKLSDNVSNYYISHLISSFENRKPETIKDEKARSEWRPADTDIVSAVIEKFAHKNDYLVYKEICRLVEDRHNEKWPNHVIELLINIAGEAKEYDIRNSYKWDQERSFNSEIQMEQLNSLRGVAMIAISNLLFSGNYSLSSFENIIIQYVEDEDIVSRAVVLPVINYITTVDRARALDLFTKVTRDNYELLTCSTSIRIISSLMPEYSKKLTPLIRGMCNSSDMETLKMSGHAFAAFYTFYDLYKEDVINIISTGKQEQRIGIAEAIQSNYLTKEYSAKCLMLAELIMNDEDEKVLHTLAGIFYEREYGDYKFSDWFEDKQDFILRFSQSNAVLHSNNFVDLLEERETNLLSFSNLIFSMLDKFCNQVNKPRRNGARDIYKIECVVDLLLRLYEKSLGQDETITNKCLDQLDVIMEKNLININSKIEKMFEK